MLKLTDDGVQITLEGNKKVSFLAAALVVVALMVALSIIILPVRWAILAVFVLAFLCFLFNRYRQKGVVIGAGKVLIKAFCVCYEGKDYVFSQSLSVDDDRRGLRLTDGIPPKTVLIQGFASEKERQVAKAVLLGKGVVGNKVAVKMGRR